MKPGAVKAASPVFNGGDEETGLCRPRLVATQLGCEISQELFPIPLPPLGGSPPEVEYGETRNCRV